MRYLIVSSVGTSLITNAMPPAERGVISNLRENETTPEQRVLIGLHADAAMSALSVADNKGVKRLSAELNGILSWMDEVGEAEPSRLHHILIATDTYAVRESARLVATWLIARGHSVGIQIPQDLRTSDLAEFRCGLVGLVRDLLPTIEGFRNSGYIPIFNVTGGFKSGAGVPADARLHRKRRSSVRIRRQHESDANSRSSSMAQYRGTG